MKWNERSEEAKQVIRARNRQYKANLSPEAKQRRDEQEQIRRQDFKSLRTTGRRKDQLTEQERKRILYWAENSDLSAQEIACRFNCKRHVVEQIISEAKKVKDENS